MIPPSETRIASVVTESALHCIHIHKYIYIYCGLGLDSRHSLWMLHLQTLWWCEHKCVMKGTKIRFHGNGSGEAKEAEFCNITEWIEILFHSISHSIVSKLGPSGFGRIMQSLHSPHYLLSFMSLSTWAFIVLTLGMDGPKSKFNLFAFVDRINVMMVRPKGGNGIFVPPLSRIIAVAVSPWITACRIQSLDPWRYKRWNLSYIDHYGVDHHLVPIMLNVL